MFVVVIIGNTDYFIYSLSFFLTLFLSLVGVIGSSNNYKIPTTI